VEFEKLAECSKQGHFHFDSRRGRTAVGRME
jgi:hypothetical protein